MMVAMDAVNESAAATEEHRPTSKGSSRPPLPFPDSPYSSSSSVVNGGLDPHHILFSVVAPQIFCVITVIGFVGNVLVIYVVLSKPQMRTVTNLLLLNLAIADLTFVLVIPPLTAYDHAVSRWTLGSLACKAMHYVINVTAYVTVYTLVIVSVVRYLTVVHNASTVRIRTRRNIIIVVSLTWLTMLLVNVPLFFSYHVAGKCDAASAVVGQRIFTTFFVFAYLLPIFIIAIFSACIVRHIAQHRPSSLEALRSRSDARKRQASRLLILVVVVFVLLWMPMHIVLLVYYYAPSHVPESIVYDVISLVAQCLPYVNSCVNPFIYGHASKDFRDAFREAVSCRTVSRGAGSGSGGGAGGHGRESAGDAGRTSPRLHGLPQGCCHDRWTGGVVNRCEGCGIRVEQRGLEDVDKLREGVHVGSNGKRLEEGHEGKAQLIEMDEMRTGHCR